MKCDLHTHTYFSDGFHSPEYLIEKAISKKLKALAITDHNSIAALPIARRIAERENIELITGVEINCESTEILGYFFDTTYEPLLKIMEENAKSINDVTMQKFYWLKDNGYSIDLNDMMQFVGPNKLLQATHLALELKKKGYVPTLQDAFSIIIKKIKIDYKPKRYSTKKVISEIINANGVAVLPHPWWLPGATKNDIEAYLSKLKEQGLAGIETTGPHPKEDEKLITKIKEIVKAKGLIETGGSDFHSLSHFPENKLGEYTVNYSVIEKLRKRII
ncbi:MAG TPA: PHP domain-containing protein [archaeon]|jgi:3',5'-nucleoside bisphosphate phosphatase|nr:PHP domain-containing protein [archaeon]